MDEHMDTETDSPQSHASPTGNNTKPLKIRKKPGRKPNPASPAVRKAQNRAAQRAFRERKEKHMKELEVDTKRLIQERDKYYKETQQLTKENDILKCENWYLKGIVLSLQMVCFKSKLRIPRHTPHIDERARNIMSSTAPPAIAVHLNGGSTSNSSTNDSNDDMDKEQLTTATPDMANKNQDTSSTTSSNNGDAEGDSQLNQPIMLNNHTDSSVSNNMAAIQALRFRLRIQSALFRENAAPYSAKPSVLQLAVPHDARIDLIPTVHMRDRMILFRNQFDLEDCLRLLINEAVFHGGNPSVAANWELPAVFFEKYWYLTTDYTMERTSQRWRQIKNMFKDDPTLAPSPPPQNNRSPSTIPLSPIPSSAYSHQGSFNATTDMESFSESQRQQHSYYQQQPHQQYWPSLGQDDQQNNTTQQGKHANHHPTHPQQPSTVATDSDILALMAPSPDIGSHYSPFARTSPASTNLHHYTNYDILPNAPPPPPSSIHQSEFVFHNDSLTQQQQDIHTLLQQDQNHQQQHAPQQQWNQSYSFMDL